MPQQLLHSNNVGLSYANELVQDDLGSQLRRLYAVYALTRHLKVNYIHSPLLKFSDQKVYHDNFDEVDLANKIFDIPSDKNFSNGAMVCTTMETNFDFLFSVKRHVQQSDQFHLIKIGNPIPLIDEKPELWSFVEEVLPFRKFHHIDFLKIAIHTDVAISVLEKITKILREQKIPVTYEILGDEMPLSLVEFFLKNPSLKNELISPPIAILKASASADLYVMTDSPLSFVCGLIHQTGIVVAAASHPKLSRWIDAAENFDETIEDCCQTWKKAREFVPSKTFFSQPSHSTPRLKNFAITYDNKSLEDGAGSQLCRIHGIYALAQELNILYHHSPLTRIGYQGVLALGKNEENLNLPKRYHEKFPLPSQVEIPAHAQIIKTPLATQRLIARLREKAAQEPNNFFLLKVSSAMSLVGRRRAMLEKGCSLSPFPKKRNPVFRIAMHVRWGDLPIGYSKRLLPNHYYINVAQKIIRVLEKLQIPYVCELHTELPEKPIIVTPEHYGVEGRLQEAVALDPDFFKIKDFEVLPHLKILTNEDPLHTLEQLATADILIMSRSAFSYLAALFNQTGTPVYAAFEYPAMPGWLHPLPVELFEEQLEEVCRKKAGGFTHSRFLL